MAQPALNDVERNSSLPSFDTKCMAEGLWFAQMIGDAGFSHYALDNLPSGRSSPRPQPLSGYPVNSSNGMKQPRWYRYRSEYTSSPLLEGLEDDGFVAPIDAIRSQR